MMNTGHLTNFIGIHTVWILFVVDALLASSMLFSITESCNYWYVIPMQLDNVLWTSLGLITLSARLVDREFRKAMLAMLCRQAKERQVGRCRTTCCQLDHLQLCTTLTTSSLYSRACI
jgi:hypothetical protein